MEILKNLGHTVATVATLVERSIFRCCEVGKVRGVEIGIVLLVLFVWIAAIALFFNRWGKIRMLLPYQPDYKQEQLKVPGTAACAAAVASGTACTHNSGDHICQQQTLSFLQQTSKENSGGFHGRWYTFQILIEEPPNPTDGCLDHKLILGVFDRGAAYGISAFAIHEGHGTRGTLEADDTTSNVCHAVTTTS
ncbi:hypothetical protein NQ317_008999, partial [Molorchus minor]